MAETAVEPARRDGSYTARCSAALPLPTILSVDSPLSFYDVDFFFELFSFVFSRWNDNRDFALVYFARVRVCRIFAGGVVFVC